MRESKGKGALIFSIIIFIICICVCIYISKNREIPSKIIKKAQSELKIEVDINDTSVKKDLSNKIDYLIYGREIKTDYISAYDLRRGDTSERGDIFNNLDNETRLRVILDFLNYGGKFSPQKNKVTGIEDVDSTIRFMGIDSVKQINSSEVEKYFKILFGDIEYTLEDVKGCFGYYYDDNNKLFYALDPTCGGTSNVYVYVYKTNYRKLEDIAYVDVYFGYVQEEDSGYVAYKDFNLNNRIDIDDFTLGNKFMTEDNYKEFEHFRFNFKLDNSNNYYFTEITN